MSKIISFIKREPVFIISALAAIVSCFFIHPSSEYINYIDFRTLALLYSLMVVVSGMRKAGLFTSLAYTLCARAKNIRIVSVMLVWLCFFTSMLITNDVALITFVPFALIVLGMTGHGSVMARVIVLQTAAANLGSMLTPIGNPQNLYIYSYYGLSFTDFILTTLPFWLISFGLLTAACFIIPGRSIDTVQDKFYTDPASANGESVSEDKPMLNRRLLVLYSALFFVCLCTVLRFLSWYYMLAAIVAVLLIFDRKRLIKADFMLLLTFTAFFIFSGNLAKIDVISNMLKNILSGREFMSAVIASQVISNVPAALLLSGFTGNARALLLGVNVGGLGTPVASLASLISLKLYSQAKDASIRRFLIEFTILNILLIAILCLVYAFM